jgi:nucleoside 2-deoxyribosyltransferase
MKIYFAGPLFTTAERDFNAAVVAGLRKLGHDVFLPQEQEQRDATAEKIFRSDVRGVDWADVVVANMDGADPDSGTCWEAGYAFGKKPVVLYRTDIREEREPFGPYNLMLHQSAMKPLLDCKWDSCAAIVFKIDEAIRGVFLAPSGVQLTEAEKRAWAEEMRDGM